MAWRPVARAGPRAAAAAGEAVAWTGVSMPRRRGARPGGVAGGAPRRTLKRALQRTSDVQPYSGYAVVEEVGPCVRRLVRGRVRSTLYGARSILD